MIMTVTPIDATLGAVITDVDLASLDDGVWTGIHEAFLQYGVLVFPGQHLDEAPQSAFALRFGNTEKLSSRQKGPTIKFSNQKPDGSLAQPDEQPTRAEMLEFLTGKIAKWWIPDDVIFIDQLPMTGTGKIQKARLRDQLKDYVLPDGRTTGTPIGN